MTQVAVDFLTGSQPFRKSGGKAASFLSLCELVIPAKAGFQLFVGLAWTPVSAGATTMAITCMI
jgi:hypothetical protein